MDHSLFDEKLHGVYDLTQRVTALFFIHILVLGTVLITPQVASPQSARWFQLSLQVPLPSSLPAGVTNHDTLLLTTSPSRLAVHPSSAIAKPHSSELLIFFLFVFPLLASRPHLLPSCFALILSGVWSLLYQLVCFVSLLRSLINLPRALVHLTLPLPWISHPPMPVTRGATPPSSPPLYHPDYTALVVFSSSNFYSYTFTLTYAPRPLFYNAFV